MKKGRLKDRIAFEFRTAADDGYGGEQETWTPFCKAWGEVFYGSGAEQREAARVGGSQVASFEVQADSKTRQITILDHRIQFADAEWNITASRPLGREGFRFTAVREVQ